MGILDRIFGNHWGIHPDDRKRPAADLPLRRLPLPSHLYVPLQQHIGAPARPIVLVGQKVLKGELIAEAQGATSAAIHAPSSGTITAVGEITAPHASGLPVPGITIECDGEDRWIEAADIPDDPAFDPFSLEPAEISRRIGAAGVVGMGGATFPSALKLNIGKKTGITTLIINGGECEPYLSCDDRVMRDFAAEAVDGIRLMLHATGAKEALVGIEDNKPEAIATMQQAAAGFPEIRICPVPARYPMGSEKHLFSALTGKEVPADGRTTDLGVLVHNVGTAAAVHTAIRHGRPLVERIVTLNGGAWRAPGNVVAPIGMLVSDIIAATEFKEQPARLIMGGPMMGTLLPSEFVPVVKGSSGLLALTAEEAADGEAQPCIRCSSCVRACPVGLLPLEMSARIRNEDYAGAVDLGLKDCIACGCCAYVCPSRIPLVQYFGHAKGELAARDRAKLRNDATKRLVAARAERLEREAKEKAEAAARRKAERAKQKAAEAAAAAASADTSGAETTA
ncbi:MAG: electron transport complex subunit RsxC [Gammaproteobacteria bacterium]|nr:electron transport complex subunit RsxC [Gammaproteobacteria bacterium]MBU1414062.1 electron transport complex subunit RsxC [Gammaproteobacteria bacterium]